MNPAKTCQILGTRSVDEDHVLRRRFFGLLPRWRRRYTVNQKHGAEFIVITADGFAILIPQGMRTDMGSIPWPLDVLEPVDKYLGGYLPHDALYHYRYVLKPKSGAFGACELKLLARLSHIEDENERLHMARWLFDRVPVRNRHQADNWLDDMIYTLTQGDAAADRSLIRGALWVASWAAWKGQLRRRVAEILQKRLEVGV